MAEPPIAPANMRPFVVWIGAFFVLWLVVVTAGNYWGTVLGHWEIAVTMLFGSYVGGSTPMGGGTVAFPILVLLLDEPASLGRDFNLAIQSFGLTTGAIFLLCKRSAIEWPMLRAGVVGTLVGTPLGVAFFAPAINDVTVKLIFAVLVASFGLTHLLRGRAIIAMHGMTPATTRFDTMVGLAVGLIGGGCLASVTGVGANIMIYMLLIFVSRADVKIAIPTSVLLMAVTSIAGFATRYLLSEMRPDLHAIDPEVYANWLAAAPIVAISTTVGVLMMTILPRAPTLIFISLLCLGQFVWTCVHEQVTGWPLAAALGAMAGCIGVFVLLDQWGRRRARRLDSPTPAAA